MNIRLLDKIFDDVINCYYITASVTYEDAVECLCPLMDKLDFQRNTLRKRFYERLEKDIISGCIMPNITVAIKVDKSITNNEINEGFINQNLSSAFILDGIQRLNTLLRASENEKFPKSKTLYCNILICNSMDKLLYRMITLNNGQKPMTARHQIEILASNMFDFDSLPILAITEKDKAKIKSKEESMSKEVLIKGYLAFVSSSINIDNQKIIEEKMNELIAEKIMDSAITESDIEFGDIIAFVDKMILSDDSLNTWFKVPNNFIGFCASMIKSFDLVKEEKSETFMRKILLFEEAFGSLDVSKIKLGLSRRKLVYKFFMKYDELGEYSVNDLLDYISQEI